MKLVPDEYRNSTWFVVPPLPQEGLPRHPAPPSTILTITAPKVPLTIFKIGTYKQYLSLQSQVYVRSPQAVRRISNRHGRHCGLWWDQAGYGYVGLNMSPDAESRFALISISMYKDVTSKRKGLQCVEGEVPVFDNREFPETSTGSGLVNFLVVDHDWPNKLGQRCTVVVIHALAWEAAWPSKENVRLAQETNDYSRNRNTACYGAPTIFDAKIGTPAGLE